MPGEETSNVGENPETTEMTDRSLITDISDTLSYLSSESRKSRQKEKLRKELVRQHIEDQKQAPTLLQSIAKKLTKQL